MYKRNSQNDSIKEFSVDKNGIMFINTCECKNLIIYIIYSILNIPFAIVILQSPWYSCFHKNSVVDSLTEYDAVRN